MEDDDGEENCWVDAGGETSLYLVVAGGAAVLDKIGIILLRLLAGFFASGDSAESANKNFLWLESVPSMTIFSSSTANNLRSANCSSGGGLLTGI